MLIIAGCDGGGGGGGGTGGAAGPSANAPVVTNFQIRPLTPEKANTQVRYRITATVTDPNNDLLGGRVEVNDGVKIITLTIDASVLRGDTIDVVLLTNPVPPAAYRSTFAVVDAGGNRSNEIVFVVNIAEASVRQMRRGPFIDRLLPAR